MTNTALVIDDVSANRDFLERLMMQAGFDVLGASGGKQALAIADNLNELAIALVDLQLPDINGLKLTAALRQQFDNAYIVVATMYDDRSLMEQVHTAGGNCFLVKPHGFMELYKRLTTLPLAELRHSNFLVIDQYGPRGIASST